MIPIRLRISGFLSYLEPVELDFTAFDLACISGANGAGKSSLLDAITWVLFGQARRRDDALLNSRAKSAEVVLDFEYEDNLFRVSRSKPRDKTTLLEFMISDKNGDWKPLTEHSVKETEARIQQTLRLDYETFTNASFFLQGKADQFAQQKPSDRKRILGGILGLEAWEEYRERAAERCKQCENDVSVMDNLIGEIDAELNEEHERKERLKAIQKELDEVSIRRQEQEKAMEQARRLSAVLDGQRQMVQSLAAQLEINRQRIEDNSRKLSERSTERQRYLEQVSRADEIEALYKKWQGLAADLRRWEELAANFHQYDTRRSAPRLAIENEKARLGEERRNLEQQERQVADWEKQIPGLQDQAQAARQESTDTEAELQNLAGIELELRSIQENLSEKTAENKALRQEMSELKERIDRLNEASGAECPLCGQPLGPQERERLVESLTRQGKEQGDRFRSNQENTQQTEQRRLELNQQISKGEGLRSQLLQQQRAVDQVEDRIKQLLVTIKNWKEGGALRLQEVLKTLAQESFSVPARQEMEKIDADLKKLGYDSEAHDAVRLAEAETRGSEEQFRTLETARAALAPLEREIKEMEIGLEKDQSTLEVAQESYQQAAAKYSADSANLPDLAKVENDLYAVQEEENRLRMRVGGAKQAVDVLKDRLKKKKELTAQKTEISSRIVRLKMLERAFGKDGVPALLIEQALPEIEDHANQILDQLSAGSMSVRFSTQKEYKDKNREDKKETLDILIGDAAGIREYELFSGGEAFRVNFAIRLALSRYLAQRAGARLQTLVIDEGFGSQDADGRQRLIQAINLVKSDFKKVLVITHLEELKDAFSARIEVEKYPNGSRIQVIV